MGIFASLLSGPVLTGLISALLGPLEQLYSDYQKGVISKEQLAERLQAAMLTAFSQVESQFQDSLTKTYTAFIQAASTNPVMARAWSYVLYSQLFVLVWHQMVIPALVTFGAVTKYAPSGATADWSYALIALCLGAPAIASRIGPASGWAASTIKGLLK